MERIKMTNAQFVHFLSNLKGCQFINVMALTDADMYLRNNPFRGRVQKFTITPMQFGYDYETAVNNRLAKEGKETNFTADKLPWGSWLEGMRNKVIVHKDMLYLRTYCVRKSRPRTYYLLDGHLASVEEYNEFKQWLKPSSTSDKQTSHGLEEEFQVKPQMGDLTSAKVTVDTRYGMIKADFKRKGKQINIQIEVPEGTSAIVVCKGDTIRLESGKHQVSIK